MASKEITQEYLRSFASYDPATGILFRYRKTSGRPQIGPMGWVVQNNGLSYLRTKIGHTHIMVHRLIWFYVTGEWPEQEIDHIDGDGLNNRWNNLRQVSDTVNMKNQRLYRSNKSGIHGVYWDKEVGCWRVHISSEGVRTYLGRGDSVFDAACLRKRAELTHGFHPNHGRTPR